MTHPLSFRELSVLRMLGNGKSYAQIVEILNAALKAKGKRPKATLASLHVTCHTLRKKLGIRDTQNPQECRFALRQRHSSFFETPTTPQPTPRQRKVLEMVAAGKPYQEIASVLGFTKHTGIQTVQNYASEGCKRIGIRVPAYQRTTAIRAWLQEQKRAMAHEAAATPKDPMTDPMF